MAKVNEVFVAGGQPHFTYVPRQELKLEEKIKEYLETRYKVLSVSGPTKTGKTVLVRSVIPKENGYWVSGGQITDIGKFWEVLLEQTGGFNAVTETEEKSESQMLQSEVGAGAQLFGIGGETKVGTSEESTEAKVKTQSRSMSPSIVALSILTKQKKPLVIDDFHYIPQELQLQIIRALKEPVFEGVPVILLSVPHRAFDAVKVEREMTGRVAQLPVTFWNETELAQIAHKGFEVLKVTSDSDVIPRMVKECFSSPHLMQDFCGQLCRENGVYETQPSQKRLSPPTRWDDFFRSRASATSKSAFDRLASGPRQRTDRIPRKLKNGKSCDIYVAVLLAIAKTGPLTELRYEEVRTALREIMAETIPQANEITRVLDYMSKIAHQIEGEPVVDWDRDESKLHISDPFFAYYLRWGVNTP